MRRRREQRTPLILPVRIWGMDQHGHVFTQDAETVDITPVGARLRGITSALNTGSIIGVQHGISKARFRVVWVGHSNQIGIQLAEPGKYIWGRPLARRMGDEPRARRTSV